MLLAGHRQSVCVPCRYVVQCMLGQGTFGQVVECIREDHGHERLAVKVIKNQQAYFQQVHFPALECPLSYSSPGLAEARI